MFARRHLHASDVLSRDAEVSINTDHGPALGSRTGGYNQRMNLFAPEFIFKQPVLNAARVRLAYGVAIATDVLQVVLGPLGWAFADETLDVIAAVMTWRLLGFHPLLLPTIVIEFLPVADMLPTWTGCVALVVALRRRQQTTAPVPAGDVIDVK